MQGLSPAHSSDEPEPLTEELLKSLAARRASVRVALESSLHNTPGIPGLKLTRAKTLVRLVRSKGKSVVRVEIRGELRRKRWALYAQRTEIVRSSSKDVSEFRATIEPLPGPSRVRLTAVGPNGEVEQDAVVLLSTDQE